MRQNAVPFVFLAQGRGLVEESGAICARIERELGLRLRRVAIRAWDLLVALPLPPDAASDAAPEFLDPPSGPVLLRVSLGPHEVAFEPPPSDRAAFARRLVETSDAFVFRFWM